MNEELFAQLDANDFDVYAFIDSCNIDTEEAADKLFDQLEQIEIEDTEMLDQAITSISSDESCFLTYTNQVKDNVLSHLDLFQNAINQASTFNPFRNDELTNVIINNRNYMECNNFLELVMETFDNIEKFKESIEMNNFKMVEECYKIIDKNYNDIKETCPNNHICAIIGNSINSLYKLFAKGMDTNIFKNKNPVNMIFNLASICLKNGVKSIQEILASNNSESIKNLAFTEFFSFIDVSCKQYFQNVLCDYQFCDLIKPLEELESTTNRIITENGLQEYKYQFVADLEPLVYKNLFEQLQIQLNNYINNIGKDLDDQERLLSSYKMFINYFLMKHRDIMLMELNSDLYSKYFKIVVKSLENYLASLLKLYYRIKESRDNYLPYLFNSINHLINIMVGINKQIDEKNIGNLSNKLETDIDIIKIYQIYVSCFLNCKPRYRKSKISDFKKSINYIVGRNDSFNRIQLIFYFYHGLNMQWVDEVNLVLKNIRNVESISNTYLGYLEEMNKDINMKLFDVQNQNSNDIERIKIYSEFIPNFINYIKRPTKISKQPLEYLYSTAVYNEKWENIENIFKCFPMKSM